MEENKKIKNIKLTLYITLILCLMVGVSYATYNLVLKGNKQHQVNIGSLTLTYEETNNINVTGDTLKTDEEGIASGNVFNFKVSVNNTTNKEINYIVYLTMDIEYLNNIDKGKVYLNNKTKNIVYGPSFITDLDKYKYENSYVLCTNTFTNATETHEYSLTSWISPKTNIFEAGGTHQTIIGGTVKFKVSVETVETTNLDTSGANAPILASNMIPVYYDETNEVWKKANTSNLDKNNPWYSYNSTGEYKGMWANAVTVTSTNRATYLNATPGTIIPIDDINTMWVWIPRFKVNTTDFDAISGECKCSNSSYTTREECENNYYSWHCPNPGAINVTFVKSNETAIDAFTFGTKSLSGFWYAKFEIGGTLASSCTNETCNVSNIVVKPNVSSLRNQTVSSFFFASRSMEQTGNSFGFVNIEVDTHMSKNNEWGAIAYLTQSIYGRCTSNTTCTEVGINNNTSYITGIGDKPSSTASSVKTNTYNTISGKNASTTGNIYGIYDMSGGAWEYVMGIYNKNIKSSGFSTLPDNKYYNNYTATSYTGHAISETKGWYNDQSFSVYFSVSPWFIRGCYYDDGELSGMFAFYGSSGINGNNSASRFVITNE